MSLRHERELRKTNGARAWSQQALAARLGVSASTVWRWEHGLSNPTVANLRRLARELDVSPAEAGQLIGWVTRRHKPRPW